MCLIISFKIDNDIQFAFEKQNDRQRDMHALLKKFKTKGHATKKIRTIQDKTRLYPLFITFYLVISHLITFIFSKKVEFEN